MLLSIVLLGLLFSFSAFDTNTGNVTAELNIKGINHINTAAEIVKNSRSSNFLNVSLFNKTASADSKALNEFVNGAVELRINRSQLNDFNRTKPAFITLSVPSNGNTVLEAELVKTDLLPDDFKIGVIGVNGLRYENYNKGLYYKGIIKGDEESIVTFSVFEDNVMGIFSTSDGNFILGSVKDSDKKLTENYVFYNDKNVVNKPGFECGSGDSYDKFYRNPLNNIKNTGNNITDATTSPIDIFFVCDYQMYIDGGNNITTVTNFVTGAFVHVKTLYANEQIPVEMTSNVYVYDTADPYRNLSTSTEILEEFGSKTQNNFTGDLTHLLSTGHGQQLGGIAWINVLCQSFEPTSKSGRYAFSNIEGTYSPYPTFSWTVMVITHETGHNIGSMHTHACAWPTTSGQIDSCYTSEGGCVTGTFQNNNGTVMSYCHLNGAINLTRGFGPFPGDTIRTKYNNALCLDNPLNSSEAPVAFKLLQNYPNPFNPSTLISFALPQEGFVSLKLYDVTGREVAKLINNRFYSIGIFSYNMDASLYNLSSGVYLYKLDVVNNNNPVYSEIKKMVLVK